MPHSTHNLATLAHNSQHKQPMWLTFCMPTEAQCIQNQHYLLLVWRRLQQRLQPRAEQGLGVNCCSRVVERHIQQCAGDPAPELMARQTGAVRCIP